MKVLHAGCGRRRGSVEDLFGYVGLSLDGVDEVSVVHLDADPALEPDVVCTLGAQPIPLPDDSIDLIVAWHVLEHVGRQGESAGWFHAWEELYRVLTPNGWLYAECPYYTSIWAWSDPTHVRALSEHALIFFMQDAYRWPGSMISPYRVRADFRWLGLTGMEKGYAVIPDRQEPRHSALRFAVQAIKPFRGWWED